MKCSFTWTDWPVFVSEAELRLTGLFWRENLFINMFVKDG